MSLNKIALGGGCHWCTEAVFQSFLGVEKVEQGYVASINENSSYSEAVIIHFNKEKISLKSLIEIHLHTHKSTSNHSMRTKYRSAIYVFSEKQKKESQDLLSSFQSKFKGDIITKVCPFSEFKPSRESIRNYYKKNPEKPFCKTFINPKLTLLKQNFGNQMTEHGMNHLVDTTI